VSPPPPVSATPSLSVCLSVRVSATRSVCGPVCLDCVSVCDNVSDLVTVSDRVRVCASVSDKPIQHAGHAGADVGQRHLLSHTRLRCASLSSFVRAIPTPYDTVCCVCQTYTILHSQDAVGRRLAHNGTHCRESLLRALAGPQDGARCHPLPHPYPYADR